MTENRQPYALVFGVSVFDICGFTDRNYRCNDSNPGKVKTSLEAFVEISLNVWQE